MPNGESANIPGSLFLIPSSLKAGEIAKVLREGFDVGLLSDGFQELMESLELDYLFIDTHPGLNEETLMSIAISDAMAVILRPDRQDFLGTAITLEVAQKLDVPNLTLLVNKVPPAFERQSLISQVQNRYDTPVAGLFYENDEMLRLASNGVFCLHYPEHPFAQEVQAVAKTLMQ
jgi:MinD-like ATPase involved in chromosome partitioning or flagellar assembly